MAETMNPDDVETFLRAHPDFLQDRPALLAALNLPHGGQGAVSLVERQVAVLRERSIASRQKLAELSDIGKENERLLKATRDTILALLSAETKADVATIWQQQVLNGFGAELGTLVWFDPDEQDDPRQSVAKKLLAGGETISGVLRPEEMSVLFPSVAVRARLPCPVFAGNKGSWASLPLARRMPSGIRQRMERCSSITSPR